MTSTNDDALLASAFRKILNPGRYSYLFIDDNPWKITLDDSWWEDDGLTVEEFEAILRAAENRGVS